MAFCRSMLRGEPVKWADMQDSVVELEDLIQMWSFSPTVTPTESLLPSHNGSTISGKTGSKYKKLVNRPLGSRTNSSSSSFTSAGACAEGRVGARDEDKNGEYDEAPCKSYYLISTRSGCENGTAGEFSHADYKHPKKQRPCKGKRERFRKLVIRISTQLASDGSMPLESIPLPPSVEACEATKAKLYRSLIDIRSKQSPSDKERIS